MRAPVHGTAVLRGGHRAVSGRIENLSLGGALVRADGFVGRDHALDIELDLPCARVALTGHVARIERHDPGLRIAVRFSDMSADLEDAIEDELVGALTAVRDRPVLVIDGVEERRRDIGDALRDRAMTPLMPRTPLEVIDTLVGTRPVDICVMSACFGDLRGAEVARFITEHFPWIRIMIVRDDAGELATDVARAWDDLEAQAW